MELAQAFNLAVMVVAALGGWLLKSLFERIKDLEGADDRVMEMLSKTREDMLAHYVRREDHSKSLDDIFNAVRRIEDKIDKKADRI